MTDRYEGLRKIPAVPAARLLADARARLGTPLDAPVAASVGQVLAELEGKGAGVDALRLMSAALPGREAVWWGCLALRDVSPEPTLCQRAAEGWVRKPDAGARAAVRQAMEAAEPADDTSVIATAAFYAPGDMGEGEMAEYDAPPGVVAGCVFAANAQTLALAEDEDGLRARLDLLLDRALDIARGGSGRVAAPAPETAA